MRNITMSKTKNKTDAEIMREILKDKKIEVIGKSYTDWISAGNAAIDAAGLISYNGVPIDYCNGFVVINTSTKTIYVFSVESN